MDACNNFLLFLTRPIVDMNKTETCMHDKCTRTVIQEMLPFGFFFLLEAKLYYGVSSVLWPHLYRKKFSKKALLHYPVRYGNLRRTVEFAGKRLRIKQLPIHLENSFNLRFDLRHCTENLFLSILLIIL